MPSSSNQPFCGGEGGSFRGLIQKANLAFLQASVQASVQAVIGCHLAEPFARTGASLAVGRWMGGRAKEASRGSDGLGLAPVIK